MKKFLLLFFSFVIVCSVLAIPLVSTAYAADAEKTFQSKAYYVVEYDTDTVLMEKNADERYPIASMVKIMTLLLTFNAVDEGKFTYADTVTISDYAGHMGGSQMFLDIGESYSVQDLIKGVVICSANDAATALGEKISGSIDAFVAQMNDYAKEIGMNNTLFCNATGLPNSGEQYSTARDVSIMTRKLLTKEKYFEFTRIWMENYTHPSGRISELVNTNKLVRMYKDCDAGKTGFTNEAMYCLSASAKQRDMRVVATVLGSPDSKTRFREITEMFQYSFANYENKVLLKAGEVIAHDVEIARAREGKLELYCDKDIKYFTKKGGSISDIKVLISMNEKLVAPIAKTKSLGKIQVVTNKGEIVCEGNIYSKNDIQKRTYLDSIQKVLADWFIK